MGKRGTDQNKVAGLRQQAEELLKSQPKAGLEKLPPEDAERLVHELRVHQIELEMQNDELRRAQEELEASRSKYADLYDFAPVSYFTFDENGLILEANLTGAGLLGIERSRLIKKPFSIFVEKDHQDLFYLHCKKVFDASDRQTCEIRIKKKDGAEFYAQMESIQVKDTQVNKSCRSSVIDITGRKRAEETLKKVYDELEIRIEERTAELKTVNEQLMKEISERKRAEETVSASLKEKEVLLQEIHHRVKNNMQVISSLLNLQSQYIRDKESAELFKESQNRIKSMALIHERLYLSADMAKIDFIAYIKNLADSLFKFYGADAGRIALHVPYGDVVFKIDTAVPCGLIVNELLSNSLKYAFPDNREGEINISLQPVSGNTFELTVSDNGIGIPEDFDIKSSKSLGLKLVEILTKQLLGKMELIRGNGTKYKIVFDEMRQKKVEGNA